MKQLDPGIAVFTSARSTKGATHASPIDGRPFLCMPSLAVAGAKEEGQAVFAKFLANFTSANADAVASLFTPDALFWGDASD